MPYHSLALAGAYPPLWAWLGRLRRWSVPLTTMLCTWFVIHPLQAEVLVDVEPLYPRASFRLGSHLARTCHVEEALSHFRQAAELAPGVSIYWNDLGAAQMHLRMWREAVASLHWAFETSGGNRPVLLIKMAMIHLQVGGRHHACEALRRAATLGPEVPLGTQSRHRWCSDAAR